MIDHVAFVASDLERSARFYDAVFHALGARRLAVEAGSLAWGIDGPVFRVEAGDAAPLAGRGLVSLRASGRAAVRAAWEAGCAAGGADAGFPADRPGEGVRCHAARLRDPDGLLLELVTR